MKKMIFILTMVVSFLLVGCEQGGESNGTQERVFESKWVEFNNETDDDLTTIKAKLQEYYDFFYGQRDACSGITYEDVFEPVNKTDFVLDKGDLIQADFCRTDIYNVVLNALIITLGEETAYTEQDTLTRSIHSNVYEYTVYIEGDKVLIESYMYAGHSENADNNSALYYIYYFDKIDNKFYGEYHVRSYYEQNTEIPYKTYGFYMQDEYVGSIAYSASSQDMFWLADKSTKMSYRYIGDGADPVQFEYMNYNTFRRGVKGNIQDQPSTTIQFWHNGIKSFEYFSTSDTDSSVKINLLTFDGWDTFDNQMIDDELYITIYNGTNSYAVSGNNYIGMVNGGSLESTFEYDHVATESEIMIDDIPITAPYTYEDFTTAINDLDEEMDFLLTEYGLDYSSENYETEIQADFFTNTYDEQDLIDFFNTYDTN